MKQEIFKLKYAYKDEKEISDMYPRLAKKLACDDISYKEVIELLEEELILPQGSILAVLGTDQLGSLSNCIILGQPHDSYAGIMEFDQKLAQLAKRRAGNGLEISSLRPKGAKVNNVAKTSTGGVSFMERFSHTTREVAQDGRRGALMIGCDIRYPDIEDFINIKKDLTKVTGANISVHLRDDFMEAVLADGDYILRWPCTCDNKRIREALITIYLEYNKLAKLNYVSTDTYVKRVKAKDLYNQIVENAWATGEPGQIFLDRHWDYSPDGVYPQYRGVNTNPLNLAA